MHAAPLIVQGQFGHYYRLHRGWFIDAPVEPEHFTDDYFAEQFVRDLRVDADDWIHLLYEIDGKPRNTYNHNVYRDLAALIVRGDINVYRVTHLDPFGLNHSARGLDYPILKGPQGASYHFVPASLFLTHRLENARFFKRDADAAKRFLDNLNLTDKQIQDIADSMRFFWWTRPRGGSTPKSLRWHLGYALEQGEIGVIREVPAPAPTPRTAEPELVPAIGPGNRPVTLGPHAGGEENKSNVASQTSAPKGFDDVYAKASMAKIEIDSIADDIATGAGGTVAKAPIKSRERAIEKINSDYGGDPHKIKDLARNTIVAPPEKVDSVAAQLKARGADVKVIDGTKDPLGYSGVNATMMTKAGVPSEIQVNSPAMIYAKESEKNARSILGNDTYNEISRKVGMPGGKGHQLYEQWRVLKPDSSEAKVLAEQSKSYYDAIRRSVYGNK